jgi:hypothetical protein
MLHGLRLRIVLLSATTLVACALALGATMPPPAGASTASFASTARCHSSSHHHFKTPHKDGDHDGCDRHGIDDGDGPTT